MSAELMAAIAPRIEAMRRAEGASDRSSPIFAAAAAFRRDVIVGWGVLAGIAVVALWYLLW